jgi:hypothetical protein
MKKILLIGDSICHGYKEPVRDALSDQAEVLFAPESGRFAEYILRQIHDWKRELKIGGDLDLIHWNAGLWDVLRLEGDEPLTPPECYAQFIRRIALMMKKLFPNAVQIFATSTPIQEEKYSTAFSRKNADIVKYNEIARAELEPLGVVINDLYPVIAAMPKEWYSDVTHFYTAPATELITNAVLESVTAELGLEPIRYEAEYKAPETVHGF